MNQNENNRNPHFGFLTIFEVPSAGFGGGLLITSCKGRPLEFHCTAPVTTNRAQEILYGQTLKSFLFCDQIGNALIQKAKSKLDVIVTDTAELAELQSSVNTPIALLDLQATGPGETPHEDIDASLARVVSDNPGPALQWLQQFTETLPLNEPFERIQQAIAEAHQIAA
ncbi:MAG: hypothetical protein MK108_09535 [Mariniblastus sp.]|nr:hypothetical protein [Mariniblastus sp.]